jgi:hypothetical protein
MMPTFGTLRDHALIYYAKIPLKDDNKVRRKVTRPVPAPIVNLP